MFLTFLGMTLFVLQWVAGLAQAGKIQKGCKADACKNHLHQLHVCLPSKPGHTRLLYRMSMDFLHWTRYVPGIQQFWKHIAGQVLPSLAFRERCCCSPCPSCPRLNKFSCSWLQQLTGAVSKRTSVCCWSATFHSILHGSMPPAVSWKHHLLCLGLKQCSWYLRGTCSRLHLFQAADW